MNIIGGPALRRADSDAVFIWLMLDEKPSTVTASVINAAQLTIGQTLSESEESAPVVSLGEHCHALLLQVTPLDEPFPAEEKLYYDIDIDGRSLSDFGLLQGERSITYPGEPLPGFFLPEKHRQIMQGSCRKPHAGNGSSPQYDHLQTVDQLIAKNVNSLETRPSMLCLTGDQIYADDVALPLLAALKEKACWLTGWSEQLPHPKRAGKVTIPNRIKLGNRDETLTSSIGFSSGARQNHLMSFGEYLAMYLVVWGGLSIELPRYKHVKKDIAQGIKSNLCFWLKTFKTRHEEYNKEKSRVRKFLTTAWQARRAMANVPTYMMFDDHEFTDDWNLTEKGYEALRTNPLSLRMQSNALAAYWACQGWGNNPVQFERPFRETLQTFLTSNDVKQGERYEAVLRQQYWGYSMAGYPTLVALDTRTSRAYAKDEYSQLISETRLELIGDQLEDLSGKAEENRTLLLLSPTPVYGFRAVELIQMMAHDLPNTVDGEPWIGSCRAYKNLLKALSRWQGAECCVISGDVHYAFVRQGKVQRVNRPPLKMYQLTSSPLHNAPGGVARFSLQLLSKAEKKTFNRNETPYLYPDNIDDAFISGHANVSLLSFDEGRPVSNQLIFRKGYSGSEYQWTYKLADSQVVAFEDKAAQPLTEPL